MLIQAPQKSYSPILIYNSVSIKRVKEKSLYLLMSEYLGKNLAVESSIITSKPEHKKLSI